MQPVHLDYRQQEAISCAAAVGTALHLAGVAILHHFPDDESNRELLSFGAQLGDLRPHSSVRRNNRRIAANDDYVALIENTSEDVRNSDGDPVLSQTYLAFPCHTDEYFLAEPADIILLLCSRADCDNRGATLLVHVDELTSRLTPDEIDVLHSPLFPHPGGSTAILWRDDDGQLQIRYNRQFIERRACQATCSLPQQAWHAIEALEGAITALRTSIMLQPNDCIVIQNRRTLHGRLGFHPSSKRKLKRLRLQFRKGVERQPI